MFRVLYNIFNNGGANKIIFSIILLASGIIFVVFFDSFKTIANKNILFYHIAYTIGRDGFSLFLIIGGLIFSAIGFSEIKKEKEKKREMKKEKEKEY